MLQSWVCWHSTLAGTVGANLVLVTTCSFESGKTRVDGPPHRNTDLSLKTLIEDFVGIIEHLFPDSKTAPSLLVCGQIVNELTSQLLGHSMGAAPILSASPILQQKGYNVPGVVVLDVVEGNY